MKKKKVKAYQGGTLVKIYGSMSECARDNHTSVQNLYCHFKLRTTYNGLLFVAEGIDADLEYSVRNHKRQRERESARNTPFSETDLSRWVSIIPEQYRKKAEKFIRGFARKNSRSIKEAFAVWYVGQDDCFIPSDTLASM